MLTFFFPNVYLRHAESLTPVVTNLSTNARGKYVPNYDDEAFVLKLGMVFDKVEVCLEFYKRCVACIGFSICSGPTGKNKWGKYWKWFVFSKEGFCHPAKMLQIVTVTTKGMSQPGDEPEERKLKRNRAKTREGWQVKLL